MFTKDTKTITREELYEAVWAEPVSKLAKSLGLSDVAVAKICRKLSVPSPGRGYWAKKPGARKLLQRPLPPLKHGDFSEHRTVGRLEEGLTRGELAVLGEEEKPKGVVVPPVLADPHLLLQASIDWLKASGLEADAIRAREVCIAITVGSDSVDRALRIMDTLLKALESKDVQPEVLPPVIPKPSRWETHAGQGTPSRTGVRILDTFVEFDLREERLRVEIPPPPSPPEPPRARRGRWMPPPAPPQSTYEYRPTGVLIFRITTPDRWGKKVWKDGKRKRLEDCVGEILDMIFWLGQREREDHLERERRVKEGQERSRREQEEAERRRLEARWMYDLESRLTERAQAAAIREFVEAVEGRFQGMGEMLDPESGPRRWIRWARKKADALEERAFQSLSVLREPEESSASPSFVSPTEQRLMMDVDTWQRRYIYGRR